MHFHSKTSKFNSIVLIDDNIVDCLINESILKKVQFAQEIKVYHHAEEGLRLLRNLSLKPLELPELIFLDLVMPGMDGFGFIREFMKLPDVVQRRTGIIMLSAYIDLIDCNRTLEYPFVVSYMSKPLNVEELLHLQVKTQAYHK